MSFFLDEEKTWLQRDFSLDRRLIKALSKLGFTYPTLIQAKCIPIIIQGKDVLVRAKTGSGKTIAFSLPILQKILTMKDKNATNGIKCIILAPTKELIKQIESHIHELIYYCRDIITVCSLSDDNLSVQKYRLQNNPDIIISTPAKLVSNLKQIDIDLNGVSTLVMDEADLVLSFGYTEDVHSIIAKMPKIFQGILMSATLSAELDKFKRIVLHTPVLLKLEEAEGGISNLLQFFLRTNENDKYLILYVFLKLSLLQGKGLIFVNDVNKCYKLKLFFQQFFITTAVLNAEVPLNSRLHIIEEFNRGVFDFLIATDASIDHGEDDEHDDDDNEQSNDDDDIEESNNTKQKNNKNKKVLKQQKTSSHLSNNNSSDYGVSRGIDFQCVNFVVNFDFPETAGAYTHRVGRTARGGAAGTSLSFVSVTTNNICTPAEVKTANRDEEILDIVRQQQPRLNSGHLGSNVLNAIGTGNDQDDYNEEHLLQPSPLQFNMKELDSFRYRVEDTLRSVTTIAVKEFRTAELKKEILNSERLKSFFAENPNDLKLLRHDKAIAHPIRQKDHLKNVPEYLMPISMRGVANVRSNKRGKKRKPTTLAGGSGSQEQRVQKSKNRNPLYSNNNNESNDDQHSSNNNMIETANNTSLIGNHNESQTATSVKDNNKIHVPSQVLFDDNNISGRKEWKLKHKKGEFNPKLSKKNTHRTPGSFIKSKNYK